MALISERDRKVLEQHFADNIVKPVKIVFFTQGDAGLAVPSQPCPTCRETAQILDEVSGLSDRLSVETHDFVADGELAREYGVDKIPALVLESEDRRLRYYGMPSGYEFTVLVEGLVNVSRGSSDLSAGARERLQQVTKPVHVQVFVTPT